MIRGVTDCQREQRGNLLFRNHVDMRLPSFDAKAELLDKYLADYFAIAPTKTLINVFKRIRFSLGLSSEYKIALAPK